MFISDYWLLFAAALGIGALIGLEREFIQQKEDTPDFAGIRTFSLISLLGALSAFLYTDYGIYAFSLALGGIILFALASYIGKVMRNEQEEGITTEVAVVLTFLLGATVMWGEAAVAAALGVIITLLLSMKRSLHNVIRRMKGKDLRAALQFALVSLVILPVLPNQTIDPWGVINPFRIWLLVVFISGIGFSGYILMKFMGPEKGLWLSGILGGLVSSTAATLSFSSRSKEAPKLSRRFAQMIILASTIMFPRMMVIVAVVYFPLLKVVALPLLAMTAASMLVQYFLFMRKKPAEAGDGKPLKLKNPLDLASALVFGLIFAVVLVILQFLQTYFGDAGVYAASALAGLTDVNPITLSVSELASTAKINLEVAGVSIVLAAVMNSISKTIISLTGGSPEIRKPVLISFGVIVSTGLLSVLLMFLL